MNRYFVVSLLELVWCLSLMESYAVDFASVGYVVAIRLSGNLSLQYWRNQLCRSFYIGLAGNGNGLFLYSFICISDNSHIILNEQYTQVEYCNTCFWL